MSKIQLIKKFAQDLKKNQQNLHIFIQILVNPLSIDDLEQNGKFLFLQACKILKTNIDKETILLIAKFTLSLIMTGHFHILHIFDIYMLPYIVSLAKGTLKLNILSSISDKSVLQNPTRLKAQFANQLLLILANWFPTDIIQEDVNQRKLLSIYTKIVEKQKIKLKNLTIFSFDFINAIEKQTQKIKQKQEFCQYCVSICQKIRTKRPKVDADEYFKHKNDKCQIKDKPYIDQKFKLNIMYTKQDNKTGYNISQLPVKRYSYSKKIREKIILNKNKKLNTKFKDISKSKSKSKQNQNVVERQEYQQKLKPIQSLDSQRIKIDLIKQNIEQRNQNFTAKIIQKSIKRKIQLLK